tara:strand:+ start:1708 stop:3513 length:1806 start_codon:yes stop_codon:yes gene_type:complete
MRTRFSGSTSPDVLRDIWRLPRLPRGSRGAMVEVHNDSWALLSRRELRRSVVSYGDGARLDCLASKLLTGRAVSLNVLGGSVSFGTTFSTSKSKALFHWKVYQWLNSTFPGATHAHFCGAVPATGPTYMEHCMHWHLSGAPDLILVEYAVNFDVSVDEDARAFERMMRKLLRIKGQPAIIIVNTMELVPPARGSRAQPPRIFFSGDQQEQQSTNGYSGGSPNAEDLSFEYRAAAEDKINAVAQYYGVPCISMRNAIWHELKANSTRFPLKRLFHDRHHPGAWGHSLMAQAVVELVRDALADADSWNGARRRPEADACAQLAAETSADPLTNMAPLLFNGELPTVGSCTKAGGLEAITLPSATKGFSYRVEGEEAKMKPGMIATRAGDTLGLCVDSSRLAVGDDFVIILGHLISYAHMGIAQVPRLCVFFCLLLPRFTRALLDTHRQSASALFLPSPPSLQYTFEHTQVECLGECACTREQVDAHVPGGVISVFKARLLRAKRVVAAGPALSGASRLALGTPPCGCAVRLTVMNESNSGEFKFKASLAPACRAPCFATDDRPPFFISKVLSLMTSSTEGQGDALRLGHQTGFNVRPTKARLQ